MDRSGRLSQPAKLFGAKKRPFVVSRARAFSPALLGRPPAVRAGQTLQSIARCPKIIDFSLPWSFAGWLFDSLIWSLKMFIFLFASAALTSPLEIEEEELALSEQTAIVEEDQIEDGELIFDDQEPLAELEDEE